MSSLLPFVAKEYSEFTFSSNYNDAGTGGHNWALLQVYSTLPSNLGLLGDIAYFEHLKNGLGSVIQGSTKGRQLLFADITIADSFKKASGYSKVHTINTRFKVDLYIPTCDDPNYTAIGTIVSDMRLTPEYTKYYLVHNRHLEKLNEAPKIALREDKTLLGYTLGYSYHCFQPDASHFYKLRPWSTIANCCSTQQAGCGDYVPTSLACVTSAVAYCTMEDSVIGGKCYEWSTRDTKSFDNLKIKYCDAHPETPACDCILAYKRDDYKKQIAENPYLAQFSTPACTYARCKLSDSEILKTTQIYTTQSGDTCAVNLQYVDQQVKINGSNNAVQTANSATTQNVSVAVTAPAPAPVKPPTPVMTTPIASTPVASTPTTPSTQPTTPVATTPVTPTAQPTTPVATTPVTPTAQPTTPTPDTSVATPETTTSIATSLSDLLSSISVGPAKITSIEVIPAAASPVATSPAVVASNIQGTGNTVTKTDAPAQDDSIWKRLSTTSWILIIVASVLFGSALIILIITALRGNPNVDNDPYTNVDNGQYTGQYTNQYQ